MSSTALFSLTGRRVLITGIQGFIGIHTAAAAQRLGAQAAGIDLAQESPRARQVRESLGMRPVEIHAADLMEQQAIVDILKEVRPAVIVHCAGSIERSTGASDWARVFAGNADVTASLVGALLSLPAAERPVLVMPGSQMEYGTAPMPWTEDRHCEPVNAYGAGKLAATEHVLAAARGHGLRACVLRLPIVFGPGQPPALFIPELIGKALRREAILMTEGNQRRAFLYVE
ncbi:MAG TPA: NAD-dependent epimerase/dehydratase family protein, partial [Candidatus Hydrogenedentes bacterium]|nr:NAD-dependent epimerase/dehydratase family protein [Candidatus Hydrogenedentota bacterium]